MKFTVPDMSCGHCKAAIEKAVKSVDSNAGIAVDLDSKIVEINSAIAPEAFQTAIKAEGFDATQA